MMTPTSDTANRFRRSVEKRRRPGSYIESPEEVRGRLTRKLFTIYNQHAPFQEQLRQLAKLHRSALSSLEETGGVDLSFSTARLRASASPLISRYVDALIATAGRWGLDRLPENQGLDALHAWCQLFSANGDNDTGLAFGAGHTICSRDPGIDTSVTVGDFTDHWRIDDEPRDDGVDLVPDQQIKRIRFYPKARLHTLNGERRWVTLIEGARTRIAKAAEEAFGRRSTDAERRAIDEQLAHIEAAAAKVGHVHPDTAHKEDKHLMWLFQRLAPVGDDGKPLGVWKIAVREQLAVDSTDNAVTEKTIRNETYKLRNQLGIKGFPKAPRKPERTPRSKSCH